MISLDNLGFLSSEAGERVLARLADEDLRDENTLKLITALRKDLPVAQAGSALELARLRKKAVRKFGDDASRMYFTKDALEQASDPLIRKWRADLFAHPSPFDMFDVCCGIGSDAFAFAASGLNVTGIDIDPVRIEMARLNADALKIGVRFEVADARTASIEAQFAFYDPGRRDEQGRRINDVEKYLPPLSLVSRFRVGMYAVKLSPGVDPAQVHQYVNRDSGIAFLSVNGELKEALLVEDFQGGDRGYGAVLFKDGQIYEWDATYPKVTAPISEPRGWLVEPDPAIIRAGLVADAALELGGAQLDPEIAYITTDEKPNSPWVRAWKIIDWMPFNLKKLRAYLRERNVGTVTVKKRGTAVTPEELIAKLKLNGSGSRTIVLSRCRGDQIVMVCDDLTIEGGG